MGAEVMEEVANGAEKALAVQVSLLPGTMVDRCSYHSELSQHYAEMMVRKGTSGEEWWCLTSLLGRGMIQIDFLDYSISGLLLFSPLFF